MILGDVMPRTAVTAVLLVCFAALLAAVFLPSADAKAASERNDYNIIAPEPWLPPKYQSPRGLQQQPSRAPPVSPPPLVRIPRPKPPIVLPNGQIVPNVPPVTGYRNETSGDRATRCAGQAATNNVPPEQMSLYMHNCTMGQ
jgi:hypothetical protein